MTLISRLPASMRSQPVGWLAALVFFALLLACGLGVYDDYGLGWDETSQVELGIRNYRYVMKGDPSLLEWRDRSYGPFFENVLVMLQSQGASRELYLSRHRLTFLSFFAGVLAVFALGWRVFRSSWLALAGSVLLAVSPRLFADAFTNTKDIPFLALYALALLSLTLLLDHPHLLVVAAHAVLSAALIDTRLPGLLIIALTLAFLLLEGLARRISLRRTFALSACYLALTLALVIAFWPALWHDPAAELLTAFQMMSRFPHVTSMLYLGQTVLSTAVPWHYIPVWIILTTPPLVLALFAAGCASAIHDLFASTGYSPACRNDLLALAALFLPLLAVIVLRSTLYDGWRQMFFLAVPLVWLAVRGLQAIFTLLSKRLRPVRATLLLGALLIAGMLPSTLWMVRNHPYQNVYFNFLAGPDLRTVQARFPLDYWGLSYQAGLDYILRSDPSQSIAVYAETAAGQRTAGLFPTGDELRLKFVPAMSEATYFLGNYYTGSQPYPLSDEVFSVQVGNAKLLSVFRLTEEEKH